MLNQDVKPGVKPDVKLAQFVFLMYGDGSIVSQRVYVTSSPPLLLSRFTLALGKCQ